ncbi:MAG: hypothetical protein A2W69_00665 [Gammaproteobacteria bacterium RIFCSPLOWO2_02_47_7]|jgi:hypothetical protein|nr:MAG: hypothetical protein A2W69_00665 [Gammaproteobacteria bacterium RIFCSPLOWO2_02_47_7]OGT86618.1 MAG: hypothetical protein A3G42_02325 [Gammaproteobacteria bacterium RIFCSPLOWO2_12_FULL_47_76]
MTRKTHHVVPDSNGGWKVKRGGGQRACRHYDIKTYAVMMAREISRHQHSELVIHNRNGRIAQSDSHA